MPLARHTRRKVSRFAGRSLKRLASPPEQQTPGAGLVRPVLDYGHVGSIDVRLAPPRDTWSPHRRGAPSLTASRDGQELVLGRTLGRPRARRARRALRRLRGDPGLRRRRLDRRARQHERHRGARAAARALRRARDPGVGPGDLGAPVGTRPALHRAPFHGYRRGDRMGTSPTSRRVPGRPDNARDGHSPGAHRIPFFTRLHPLGWRTSASPTPSPSRRASTSAPTSSEASTTRSQPCQACISGTR